jgi:protein-L-isoaspartate(D-aspartate) O-methyltransferase
MLSTQPVGFTFAFHPDHGDWIGYSTPLGFSLASFRQPNLWLISDTKHADVLRMWWSKWESLGKPSYEQLSPFLIDDKVKVRLKGGV